MRGQAAEVGDRIVVTKGQQQFEFPGDSGVVVAPVDTEQVQGFGESASASNAAPQGQLLMAGIVR